MTSDIETALSPDRKSLRRTRWLSPAKRLTDLVRSISAAAHDCISRGRDVPPIVLQDLAWIRDTKDRDVDEEIRRAALSALTQRKRDD